MAEVLGMDSSIKNARHIEKPMGIMGKIMAVWIIISIISNINPSFMGVVFGQLFIGQLAE